jgi:hypothetical protein
VVDLIDVVKDQVRQTDGRMWQFIREARCVHEQIAQNVAKTTLIGITTYLSQWQKMTAIFAVLQHLKRCLHSCIPEVGNYSKQSQNLFIFAQSIHFKRTQKTF